MSEAAKGYLIATDVAHCASYLPIPVEYIKLPDATVLAVLKEGNYLLAKVNPPNQLVTCFLHSRGDLIEASVQQVYELIQTEAIAWCEL